MDEQEKAIDPFDSYEDKVWKIKFSFNLLNFSTKSLTKQTFIDRIKQYM